MKLLLLTTKDSEQIKVPILINPSFIRYIRAHEDGIGCSIHMDNNEVFILKIPLSEIAKRMDS